MDMFTHTTFSKVMALRAVSAASLILVMCAFFAASYIPSSMALAVAVAGFTFMWVITAPVITVHYVYGIAPNLRWLLARKRRLSALPGLRRLAERMDAPLPRRIELVAADKPNAGTDGTTLSITTGFVPYLRTSVGEASLAHELAHAKLHHPIKRLLAVAALCFVSWQFGALFTEIHTVTGTVVSLSAFFTLQALVFPLISRKMEYDADSLAIKVVKPSAMIGALKTLVPTERWDLESDSHPSVRARIQRLRTK